jgi:hypothetical protein
MPCLFLASKQTMEREVGPNSFGLETRPHKPYVDWLEIAVGYGLILATIWSAHPVRTYFGWLAVIWLVVVLLHSAQSITSLGLGLRGLRESLWAVGVVLLGIAVLVVCAAVLGTLHYHHNANSPFVPVVGYLTWSFMQQFILQNVFMARLLRLVRRPSVAVCIGGLLLSLAHLPNPLLVAATLFWGVCACWLFLHYRNLYAVALIHFLLGVSLAACVPSSLHHNMRVGWGYEHQHPVSYTVPSAAGASHPTQQLPKRAE